MKLTGRRSQCSACGEVFTCPSSFDQHRRGHYHIAAPHYGRTCVNVAESPGWTKNRNGLWFRCGKNKPFPVSMFRAVSTITTDPVHG